MILFILTFAFLANIYMAYGKNEPVRPVVLMHGILKSSHDMELIRLWLEESYPGIYVHNMEIGDGGYSSVFMNLVKQGKEFARNIENDRILAKAGEIDVICHSMGGLTCRNYIQNFQNQTGIYVRNAVFLSSPNAGFFCDSKQTCPVAWEKLPQSVLDLIRDKVYTDIAQQSTSAANMWKDPYNIGDYIEKNIFFPSNLDNLVKPSEGRKLGFASLKNLILIASPVDGVISPWQSSHFGFLEVDENGAVSVVNMRDSDFYKNDTFGLKTLDEIGNLHLITINKEHTWYMTEDAKSWMIENIIKKYIGK